jgi:cysteine synthase
VDEMIAVSNDQAIEGQRMFAKKTGIFPGVSSGANFYAASVVSQKFRESIILTVAYDQGEGYLLKRIIENDEWILSNYNNSVKSTSKG